MDCNTHCKPSRSMLARPNIVLIFSDQHRGDALGCVGNPAVRTPNLDDLVAEGVIFRSCNTSSPLCMLARTSLMTGMYVNEHGAWGIEPRPIVTDRVT